ncbi:MAG: hypothetical protein ACKERG_04055 [Candidatus Hodgkinia cicadicola]
MRVICVAGGGKGGRGEREEVVGWIRGGERWRVKSGAEVPLERC